MAFDAFRGYVPDTPASIFDVERRKKLADTLLGNRVQNGSQFGAIADALAGTLSGYENTQAANESQSGYENANKALGAALSGDMNPSDLIQAGSDPFLPASSSGLVGDLIKRKMGIGETFYGTPIVAVDPNDPTKVHYYQAGSLGDMREMKPGDGQQFAPKQQFLNQGDQFQAVPTNAGVVLPTSPGSPSTVPINNTQTEIDKGLGSGIAADTLKQKTDAESAGKLLNIVTEGEGLLDQGAFTGAGAGGKSALTKWAATLGIPVPQDAANNSDAFKAVMGQAVGQIIKQFGSGTGLSDADRQYATQIAGGDIELNEAAIRKIIAIAKKNAQATIDQYNQQSKSVQSGDVGKMLQVNSAPSATAPAAADPLGIR